MRLSFLHWSTLQSTNLAVSLRTFLVPTGITSLSLVCLLCPTQTWTLLTHPAQPPHSATLKVAGEALVRLLREPSLALARSGSPLGMMKALEERVLKLFLSSSVPGALS